MHYRMSRKSFLYAQKKVAKNMGSVPRLKLRRYRKIFEYPNTIVLN